MTHETLTSAWRALVELGDLSLGLRESVGAFVLRSCRSSYHPVETPQRFLEYCLELSLTLDVIRFLSRTNPQSVGSITDDLISAVSHLLQHTAHDLGGSKGLLTESVYVHILGRTLCSAVCALRAYAWDCQPELRQVLARASQRLLTNTPVSDNKWFLVQTLAHLLSSHYGNQSPVEHPSDQGQMRWRMLWEAAPEQRQDLVSEMVGRATDHNVAAIERIIPVLNLCQLYWDTDAVLLQDSTQSIGLQQSAKIFFMPDGESVVHLALDTRFMVQQQFAMLAADNNVRHDVLNTQHHVLFGHFPIVSCALNDCDCPSDPYVAQIISEMHRNERSKLVRTRLTQVYSTSEAALIPIELLNRTFQNYARRLTRWQAGKTLFNTPASTDVPRQRTSPSGYLQPTTPNPSQNLMNSSEVFEHPLVKARSASQPDISRQHLRSKPSLPRSKTAQVSVNGVLDLNQEEENVSEQFSNAPTCPELVSSKPKAVPFGHSMENPDSHGDRFKPISTTPVIKEHTLNQLPWRPKSPSPLGRADSSTTATSSKINSLGSADSRPGVSTFASEKLRIDSLPEAIEIYAQNMPVSPVCYEKYPEVATIPMISTEPDSLSLFSEDDSMRITSPSIRPNIGKKWPTFMKGSKRPGSQFAVPKVRFSASGKSLMVWTRYGGGAYDISNSESPRFHAINVQDIIFGACGSNRYGVVARINEGFVLNVYELGAARPFISIELSHQPAAIDISPNDRFVAIKYSQFVRIFDVDKKTKLDHKLPRPEAGKPGPSGHLVAFAHDSESFMASTRLGPEKVVTYWSSCSDKNNVVAVQSTAPCGHMDDHGLTSLTVCGPKVRGIPTGFLCTFTEKGLPAVLAMSSTNPQARPLRDTKGVIGTRIHDAGMYVDPRTGKSHLVLVNQNNDILWTTDLFGRDQETRKVRSLKRPKSMQPEVMVSMTSADEASILWIDKGSHVGTIMKVGKEGGMVKLADLNLAIEPLCSA